MLVLILPIRNNYWGDIDNRLLYCVSPERQKKVMSYVRDSDRKLSLYAALVARMGLSQISGISPSKLIFHSPANYKPTLLNCIDFDFSFSHTHEFIICCISKKDSVGADVEKIENAPFEVMEQVFHPEEILYVQSAPNGLKDVRFFEIWTRKEAYTKQLGVGLVYNLPSCNTLSFPINQMLHTWRQDGYICSISGRNLDSIQVKQLSENDIWDFFICQDFK